MNIKINIVGSDNMDNYEEETTRNWMILVGFILIIIVFAGLYITGWLRPPALPEAPEYVSAKQINNTIELSWQVSTSPSVIGYNIYRSQTPNTLGNKINDAPITNTFYIDNTLSSEGDYYYIIRSVDAKGNEDENLNSIYIYFDTSPPIITAFTAGIKFTNNPHIMITLVSSDAHECRFKSNVRNWTQWERYITQKDYNLESTTDGLKTIYVQCKDKFNNIGSPMSYNIYLDRVAPRVIIGQPLENNTYNTGNISIAFSIMDDYKQNISCDVISDNMLISSENISITGVNESYYNGKINIPSEGSHKIMIRCHDQAGNLGLSQVNFKTISLSESMGFFYSININGGDRKTYDRDVTITINPKENVNITRCRFRNENNTWSDYYDFQPVIDWTLSEEYEKKTVYSECYDKELFLGREWDDIILEKESEQSENYVGPPTGVSLTINNGNEYTNDYVVNLHVEAHYADECKFSEKYGSIPPMTSTWESYTPDREWHLYEGEGFHSIKVICRNKYGETSDTALIFVDTTPPGIPVDIWVGKYIGGQVEISWDCPPETDGSGISHYNVYRQTLGEPSANKKDYKTISSERYSPIIGWIYIGSTDTSVPDYYDSQTHPDTTYKYAVTAVDRAGNEGDMSEPSDAIVPDFYGPTVTIENPNNNDVVDNHFTVDFRYTEDLSEELRCEYYLDNRCIGMDRHLQVADEGYSIDYTIPSSMIDKTHNIKIICYDEAENPGEDSLNVIVPGIGEGGGGGSSSSDIPPNPNYPPPLD
ncbi:hypothetical protein J7J26_00740 [Candidatus Micrarchaeota archaeon]|nr:hypothetical protein [Candidatus Micrarchaeota archaeon]